MHGLICNECGGDCYKMFIHIKKEHIGLEGRYFCPSCDKIKEVSVK